MNRFYDYINLNKLMKKLSFTFALVFITGLATLQAQQTINQEKSKIDFHITSFGLFKVEGTFTSMKGDFNLDLAAPETGNFNICVDASTVNTGNEKRDTHLRNPDFFEVEKYPTICFVSSSVTPSSDGYIAKGNLTMHGVTKEVEIPFTFSENTFVGELTINRFDYDIGKEFGTARVGEEAIVTITCIVN